MGRKRWLKPTTRAGESHTGTVQCRRNRRRRNFYVQIPRPQRLTELGIWSNQTENQYYRRIIHLVSAKIMPKIWTVAGMMLRSPQTALYWGSYLMKICTEVKTLCMQFESVVTNGSLSFNDIAFLQLNPQVASLFTLSENGGINWKTFLDDLGDIPHNFTKENLKADLDNLYNMGVNIATAGTENLSEHILGESNFHLTCARKL